MAGSFWGSSIVRASTWTLKRALMNWRAFSPCSGLREVMVTCAPSWARRGVRSVGVEHDGDAERVEHGVLRHGQQLLAGRHVGAADPDGGVGQVFRSAGEDASVDQVADVTLGHPAVTHDRVRTGVVGHDLVEHARQPGAVELKQELAHCRTHLP
jgi:hypothetical protein